MYWSGAGCLINLALAVITLGSWLVVAGAYYLITAMTERPRLLVRAFYGGQNLVRLQVEAARISTKREPEYLAEIDEWIINELNAERLSGPNENQGR
jgi:hypothetical protein